RTDKLIAEIARRHDQLAELTAALIRIPTLNPPGDNYKEICDFIADRLTPPEYVVSPGTYDQKHIDRIGRLKNCIAYGPGILDLAHQPDEWVGINDMVNAGQVMALALDNLLHGAGPGA
ncbi:MAG: succinyl-diaminopimelate desuccinylase, partial [Pseudomonadota bacterium]